MKEKKCKLCGELFTPKCSSNIICDRDHIANCPICDREIVWNSTRAVEPCSKECRRELTRRNNILKYGVEHPMQSKDVQKHHRQAMLDKYGVEHPMQSEELKKKAIETNQAKFGSDWAMSNKDIKHKAEETMLAKYGGKTTLESPVLRKKVEETLIDRYGVCNPMQIEKAQNKVSSVRFSKYATNECEELCLTDIFKSAIPNSVKAFMNALNQNGIEGKFGFALSRDYIYDIAIPDQKILVDIDPTYTHNAIGNFWTKGLSKNYHLNRTKVATEKGYRCIHIFDWDDWDKIIELLKPKKKIYGRQCKIYKLDPKVADEFLDKYHLQGTVRNQVVNLGLVKNNELIQVMTFGKPRFNSNYACELLRLCTKPEYIVVGGAEKLFKFATNQLGIDDIISYCDLSKFKGDVYIRIGMRLLRNTEPQEIWSRGDRKITANLLRQRGFDQLFDTSFGKGVSNEDLMIRDGWLPVYDCGQSVFEYRSI